uniref:BTB domain-containing protein n=1 Tax=Steinernema glaseri TaxID=37863 RepID=A0A1I7Y7W7_9BILA
MADAQVERPHHHDEHNKRVSFGAEDQVKMIVYEEGPIEHTVVHTSYTRFVVTKFMGKLTPGQSQEGEESVSENGIDATAHELDVRRIFTALGILEPKDKSGDIPRDVSSLDHRSIGGGGSIAEDDDEGEGIVRSQ